MSDQEEKLCDRCHKRPATVFIDYGGSGRKENVCAICSTSPEEWDFPQTMLSPEHFKEAIEKQNGKCKYCGEPAKFCIYWTSSISRTEKQSLDDGDKPFRLLCETCRKDEGDFYLARSNSSPEEPVDDDPEKRLLRLSTELANYMRKKIQQRRSGDAGN